MGLCHTGILQILEGKERGSYSFPVGNDLLLKVVLYCDIIPSGKGKCMEKLSTISEIGSKMRAIRKEQHISQETLAGLAGTGTRYVSELERGKETIRTRELMKLLDALGAWLYILTQKEVAEWKRLMST